MIHDFVFGATLHKNRSGGLYRREQVGRDGSGCLNVLVPLLGVHMMNSSEGLVQIQNANPSRFTALDRLDFNRHICRVQDIIISTAIVGNAIMQ